MRILHVISSGGMYGAEAVILNLCGALQATGEHQGLLAVFENSIGTNLSLHEAALRADFESHLVPCRGQFDPSVGTRIRSLVKQTNADVIHAHGYKADIYTWLAMRRMNVALVSTCHTWYDNDVAVRIYGALDRWVLRSFDLVVAVSEQVRLRLLKAGVRDTAIRMIRNGVDVRPFAAAAHARSARNGQNDGLRVGLVGRLAIEKGVDVFIQAAAKVQKELPDIKFVVAGDGPDHDQLQQLIDQLGVHESVSLLGRTENMIDFYGSLDLLVSASRQEGLPVALLEGMASAAPLIATPVGAVPELVHDGQTGLMVAPGDPDALAGAIVRMLRNPELRLQLGTAGQQWIATEFSATGMAEKYLEVYREALTGKRNRG